MSSPYGQVRSVVETRRQSALQRSIKRIVYEVTSVLLEDGQRPPPAPAVVPVMYDGKEADDAVERDDDVLEEATKLLSPASPGEETPSEERVKPRSFEIYNESRPTDLNDLDVFSSRRRSVDGDDERKVQLLCQSRTSGMARLEAQLESERQRSQVALADRLRSRNKQDAKDEEDVVETFSPCPRCDDPTQTQLLSLPSAIPEEGEMSEDEELPHASQREVVRASASRDDDDRAPVADEEGDKQCSATSAAAADRGNEDATEESGSHEETEPLLVRSSDKHQRRIGVMRPALLDKSAKSVSVKNFEHFKSNNLGGFAETDEGHGPRGRRRQRKTQNSQFGVRTRARRSLIYRSWFSRVSYLFLLCNLIVWIPLWLKLLTIERNETDDHRVSIFNSSVGLDLYVSTFDAPNSTCSRCDDADDWTQEFGVTYEIRATVTDYWVGQGISSASYIALLASYNFKDWFIVSNPGILTDLPTGDSVTQVCRPTPLPRDDDDDDDDDDEVNETDDETVDDDTIISTCCLDKPGFIYLVACATPFEYLSDPEEYYWQLKAAPTAHTLEGTCVQVHGRCGSACHADARIPVPGTCKNGVIPKDLLIDERYVDLTPTSTPTPAPSASKNPTTSQPSSIPTSLPTSRPSYVPSLTPTISAAPTTTIAPTGSRRRRRRRLVGNKRRHFDNKKKHRSPRRAAYHASFVCLVTMMAVGTWVSFLAGCGMVENDDSKPTMSCVEVYMAEDSSLDKKPLLLCAFSISASEGPMMILRNMCGKLMSWIYQRKFVLVLQNSEMTNVFAHTADPRAGFRRRPSIAHDVESANLSSHVEYIDIFQDEGHRVGAYALWDAFVNMVNNSDLRFLECLANKMDTMTADDKKLLGKKFDDGKCLDDEMRSLAAQPDMGISQENIGLFELAFATFDLLNALGHHAFWRSESSSLEVISFHDLSGDERAVAALLEWAANFKIERKRSGRTANPFAANCPPTHHAGISANIWNSWWLLYDEMGRIQWCKRYDVTKFWNCRLNYYRKDSETVQLDLMCCYAARANPEDVNFQFAPTVLRRGVSQGVFVRIKQTDMDSLFSLYEFIGIRPMSRSTARRCHARVVGSRFSMFEKGRRSYKGRMRPRNMVFIKVKECTPEFLSVLPQRYLTNYGQAKESGKRHHKSTPGYKFEGEEAIIPLECVQPLRESRGKSGGMNHAMEILNYYLRYESATFKLLETKRKLRTRRQKIEVPENSPTNAIEACLLFAVFDCRHMAVQGFWNAVIPYFYHYKHQANPWSTELEIDHNVAFVQLPQSFSSLTIEDDIFDMRNEYLFRLANNIRSGVGAITSCGTNAVWNYDIKFQNDPLEHRFNEDTMIEDTASSHDVIIAGRKGVYHFERLVLGARKGTTDYLAAVFRWSKGAVQLFWTTFWFPRYGFVWPFAMVCVHVVPIVGCVVYLQLQKLDQCHRTYLASKFELLPCDVGPLLGIASDPLFLIFAIIMVSIAVITFHWPRLGAYTVMFENVTYFFSSISAFYWAAMPCYMCIARHGIPPAFDTQLLTAGALWLQLHCGLIINQIKAWSPLENGSAPSDQSLLRSQQMYFVTAPLHALAICQGMREGFMICFMGKDASRWGSFDSRTAMSTVKLWVVSLLGMLVASIIWGIYNAIFSDVGRSERGIRALGVFFCFMLLYIVITPIRAMFFYKRVIAEKKKPSVIDRVTAALFGKKQPIRPDYVYVLLWVFLLVFALRRSELDRSDGILNGRSRCSIDHDEPGCEPDDLYLKVRNPGRGILK